MLKKIIITLLITVLLFGLLEFISFLLVKRENDKYKSLVVQPNERRSSFKTEYKLLEPFKTSGFRKSVIKENTDKKPILWFGCSFAQGAGLSDKEEPCYKISELTGRSCINKSKGATGTQFMYYQLKQNSFKEEIPEADFIIYTFIWHHLQRLYNYQVTELLYMHNLRYELKNNKLKEINPQFNPIYSSFFVKRVLSKIKFIQGNKERKDFNLFNKIMEESVKTAKEKYPNAKFIMIEFPEIFDIEIPEHEVKKLESYGITVVKAKDLLPKNIDIKNKENWLEDRMHPKAEIWDIILPQIKEKYLN